MIAVLAIAVIGAVARPSPAPACSICGGDFKNRQTLRQEAAGATVVVFGALSNARLTSESGDGQTDLQIKQILKGGPIAGTALTLSRYYPGDGKLPPKGLFFFDVRDGRLALRSGRTIRSEQVAEYLKGACAIAGGDTQAQLRYFLRHLDHSDPDIAADAFLELARAADADLARAAKSIPPERLRRLLTNPESPRERIGLIAFLLACAGSEKDAELFLKMLKQVPEDCPSMRRGLLVGYTALRPRDGWKFIQTTLADSRRGFLERHAAIGALEFFHNWQPQETRDAIVRCLKPAVESGDLADMAIENLRRWQWWDLTAAILAQDGRPSHDAPLIRRAIVRYAIACPEPAGKRFLAELKKREPDLVAEAVQSLEIEK